MTSNKRRKLDLPAAGKNISAYAARIQYQATNDLDESHREFTSEESERSDESQNEQSCESSMVTGSKHKILTFHEKFGHEIFSGSKEDLLNSDSFSDSHGNEDGQALDTIIESRVAMVSQLPEQPMIRLTTVDLNDDKHKRFEKGPLCIEIAPGEKLVVLGEYGISVVKGQVTVLGATLSAGNLVYAVHSALSHSLPVIRFRASETAKAEIRLYNVHHGLRSLEDLSPLFSGLWNHRSAQLEPAIESSSYKAKPGDSKKQSFHILLSTPSSPQNVFHPIVTPAEWNEMLFKCVSGASKPGKPNLTMICGPKSSGKSTFARLLLNTLLTSDNEGKHTSSNSSYKKGPLAVLLDLDPGQPEYSPPGQLSLVLLSKPNFGPPYSHPDAFKSGQKLLRAHSIAAVSRAIDPSFYMECVTDLLSHYFDMQSSTPCPLVINTPGWVLGTGLEILLDLVRKAQPTQVIYMSQEGPQEVVQGLRDAANLIPVSMLPSQATEYTTRTEAHLRTMQYISYFHLDPANTNGQVWNANSLTSVVPWEVKYRGKNAGILGILCLGEQPPISLLKNTIDGTLLAVVVLDDNAAIRSWRNRGQVPRDSSGHSGEGDHCDGMENSDFLLQDDRKLERPFIVRTPEGIPYFDPASVTTLDPRYSQTIGLALVRGIDSERQRLQLLTPIAGSILKGLRASQKDIVLVSGKLDTPGWAYTEDFYKRAATTKRHNNAQAVEGSDYEEESGGKKNNDEQLDGRYDESPETGPWTERLYGDEGRGAGARVWRVRRDLGRAVVGD